MGETEKGFQLLPMVARGCFELLEPGVKIGVEDEDEDAGAGRRRIGFGRRQAVSGKAPFVEAGPCLVEAWARATEGGMRCCKV